MSRNAHPPRTVKYMPEAIKPDNLSAALTEQLGIYHKDIVERINAAGENAVEDLVQKTKTTAPKRTGSFRKSITWGSVNQADGCKRYIWYAKAPHHRLVHLLVHGHATRSGGRTKGDPFLQNALNTVLPEYEKSIEEALADD